MKLILTISCIVYALLLKSQNFTNGSVYNYSVGDTIVSKYQPYYGFSVPTPPPTYIYRVFKQKSFSANLDTVFYVTYDTYVSMTNCYPCTQVVTSTLTNFFVTNLNSSAISYTFTNMDSCQKQVDTSYLGNCGHFEHLKYATKKPPPAFCFEPPTLNDLIIEGVGLFSSYRSLNFPNPGFGSETKLVSFHKVGETSCGKVGSIPNGLRENTSDFIKLKVVPNPFSERFEFEITDKGLYFLYDQITGLVISGEALKGRTTVSTQELPAGLYFLLVKTKDHSYWSKLIKQ